MYLQFLGGLFALFSLHIKYIQTQTLSISIKIKMLVKNVSIFIVYSLSIIAHSYSFICYFAAFLQWLSFLKPTASKINTEFNFLLDVGGIDYHLLQYSAFFCFVSFCFPEILQEKYLMLLHIGLNTE